MLVCRLLQYLLFARANRSSPSPPGPAGRNRHRDGCVTVTVNGLNSWNCSGRKGRREGQADPDCMTLDSPIQYDGSVSPAGAARMRMIALTPRRGLEKAASNLTAQSYSPRQKFEAQALEQELLSGFKGFFSNRERLPEGLGSPLESPHSKPPRPRVSTAQTSSRVSVGDYFGRRGEPAAAEPFSPKKRGCAVAPSLSELRLQDANLRCEAPSPGPQWSAAVQLAASATVPEMMVKTIFPGPCKVQPLRPFRALCNGPSVALMCALHLQKVRPYTRATRGCSLSLWKSMHSTPARGVDPESQDVKVGFRG